MEMQEEGRVNEIRRRSQNDWMMTQLLYDTMPRGDSVSQSVRYSEWMRSLEPTVHCQFIKEQLSVPSAAPA